MEALQIPIILTRIPDMDRRMSTTTQLFTRLDKNFTERSFSTRKQMRMFPHSLKKQSLDNSKENMNYENYLYKVKSAIKIDGEKMTSNYLLSLRKEYDKMAKNIKIQSTGINVMKKDIQFIRNKLKNQTDSMETAQQKVEYRKRQLTSILNDQQYGKMQTKSLEYVIERMKQDELKQKNNMRLREEVLKEKKKELKTREDEVVQWDQTVHKIQEEMEKIKRQFQKHSEEREWKLKDYESHVVDLEEQEKFQFQRNQRTFQLVSIQLNDILDAKNIVLRDVLLANKALDKMLQCKISDLLNHYQDLQSSYHIVKTETNITDPQILVKKFFSYGPFLQQMTSTISFYQNRQEQLMKRNKTLKDRQIQNFTKKLEEDKTTLTKSNSTRQEKQLLIQQTLEKQVILTKIKSWLEKINMSLFGMKYVGEMSQNIGKIHKYLLKSINQVQSSDSRQWKFESPRIRLKKFIKEITLQDEKPKKIETQEMIENNLLENQYLSHEKKKTKKNNHFHIKTTQFLKNNNK